MKGKKEYPATHSMSTAWYAADEEGNSKIDFDFGATGHSLCIVDTKGDHANLTDEYAAVRKEMEAVAAVFGDTYGIISFASVSLKN